MTLKFKEKERAIELRRTGFSYSEILKNVPVAKSTLSLWLHSVNLSKRQKQRLTEKKLAAMQRGWAKTHQRKLDRIENIKKETRNQVNTITRRELWLIGSILYWAEGTKEKSYSGHRVSFNNSDPCMIKVFLKWLREMLEINEEDIHCEIYLHENSVNRVEEVKDYWSKVVGEEVVKIYFKKNKKRQFRKNMGKEYFGLLRVSVKKSTDLNRKIAGWIEGICKNCGVV